MSQAQNLTVPKDCIARAKEHDASAEKLFVADDEWAAVAYFYASYHRARAAILADPVFDSLVDLPKADPRLTKEHQMTSRHEGRMTKDGRDVGVNDLVRKLYRDIYAPYLVLHDASIQVRYGHGISAQRLDDVRAAWKRIADAYDAGQLIWTAP